MVFQSTDVGRRCAPIHVSDLRVLRDHYEAGVWQGSQTFWDDGTTTIEGVVPPEALFLSA